MTTKIQLCDRSEAAVEAVLENGELPMVGVRVYAGLAALGVFLAPHEALQMAAALAKAAADCQEAMPAPAMLM